MAWPCLHTLTHTFLIPRLIISLLPITRVILPRYTALRFISIHMVGIIADGYFSPTDSQLASACVQVLVEVALSMTLSTRCEGVSDEFSL
jgi:hypothetical protein